MLLHLLVALSLWLSASPFLSLISLDFLVAVLFLLVLGSAVFFSAKYHWRSLSYPSVIGIYFNRDQWQLLCDGCWVSVELDGEQLIWRSFQLLNFRDKNLQRHRVLLMSDTVIPDEGNIEEYRKLRMLLMMGLDRLLAAK